MSASAAERPLRLWPGVVIVVLQFLALYVPGYFAPASPAMFFGMMGSLTLGPLLLIVWWLFFSRAKWSDRLGGVALLIVIQIVSFWLADPSAQLSVMVPGIPWLCAAFVASLFAGKRWVTIAAVLFASLIWTMVRTDGVTGAMESQYSWRWSATAEDRFMASDASQAPAPPAPATPPPADVEPAAESVESDAEVEPPAIVAAWPGFRGADRDNVVRGVTIGTDWSSDPPKEIWRRPVGPGWSSFALVDGHLCTQEQRDEDEVVVCYDADTGEPIWLHAYSARFWEAMGGVGPRATPTYHDGRLYVLGATGILNCLDLATGQPIWTRDITEDTGAEVPDWAFSSSPLVVGDLVIVHAAGAPDGEAAIAYDLATGEPRWTGEAPGASYSSPHLVVIDEVPQAVLITGDGAFGLAPESGELLWKHDWPMGGGGSRVVQPALTADGGILIGTSFGVGTRKVEVSSDGAGGWTVEERWTSRGLKPYYNDLVVHEGAAYGFDGNILAAIDLDTGERAWKRGRYGNGQVLVLPDQDLLVVISEKGELVLVRATAAEFEEIARLQVLDGKTWNHPIIANGVIYLRNAKEMAAYRLP